MADTTESNHRDQDTSSKHTLNDTHIVNTDDASVGMTDTPDTAIHAMETRTISARESVSHITIPTVQFTSNHAVSTVSEPTPITHADTTNPMNATSIVPVIDVQSDQTTVSSIPITPTDPNDAQDKHVLTSSSHDSTLPQQNQDIPHTPVPTPTPLDLALRRSYSTHIHMHRSGSTNIMGPLRTTGLATPARNHLTTSVNALVSPRFITSTRVTDTMSQNQDTVVHVPVQDVVMDRVYDMDGVGRTVVTRKSQLIFVPSEDDGTEEPQDNVHGDQVLVGDRDMDHKMDTMDHVDQQEPTFVYVSNGQITATADTNPDPETKSESGQPYTNTGIETKELLVDDTQSDHVRVTRVSFSINRSEQPRSGGGGVTVQSSTSSIPYSRIPVFWRRLKQYQDSDQNGDNGVRDVNINYTPSDHHTVHDSVTPDHQTQHQHANRVSRIPVLRDRQAMIAAKLVDIRSRHSASETNLLDRKHSAPKPVSSYHQVEFEHHGDNAGDTVQSGDASRHVEQQPKRDRTSRTSQKTGRKKETLVRAKTQEHAPRGSTKGARQSIRRVRSAVETNDHVPTTRPGQTNLLLTKDGLYVRDQNIKGDQSKLPLTPGERSTTALSWYKEKDHTAVGPCLPSLGSRPISQKLRQHLHMDRPAQRVPDNHFSIYSQPLPLTRETAFVQKPNDKRHHLIREYRSRREMLLQEIYLGPTSVNPREFLKHVAQLQRAELAPGAELQVLAPTFNVSHPSHETYSVLGNVHWRERANHPKPSDATTKPEHEDISLPLLHEHGEDTQNSMAAAVAAAIARARFAESGTHVPDDSNYVFDNKPPPYRIKSIRESSPEGPGFVPSTGTSRVLLVRLDGASKIHYHHHRQQIPSTNQHQTHEKHTHPRIPPALHLKFPERLLHPHAQYHARSHQPVPPSHPPRLIHPSHHYHADHIHDMHDPAIHAHHDQPLFPPTAGDVSGQLSPFRSQVHTGGREPTIVSIAEDLPIARVIT